MTLILWGTSLPLSVPGVFFVVTLLAYLALFGWIPAVVVIFALLPARQAAAIAVIGGWLLLPPYRIAVSNFPDYSKITAASLGMMFGTLFFGSITSSHSVHGGSTCPCYFGVSAAWFRPSQTASVCMMAYPSCCADILTWGLPYFFGRIYFGDSGGLYTLTVGIIIGGLAYVLPCLWEVRMSPNLLGRIYGSSNWQGTRFGGYRPNVFFNTGLECGMWMTAVSLTAWWLWRCGVVTKIGGISFGIVWLPILLVVTFLCRSSGSLFLLTGGIAVLWASARFRTRMLLVALVLFGPVYVGLRIPNLWSGKGLVRLFATYFSESARGRCNIASLARDLLIDKAIEQPVFGWGGWGRSDVYFGTSI